VVSGVTVIEDDVGPTGTHVYVMGGIPLVVFNVVEIVTGVPAHTVVLFAVIELNATPTFPLIVAVKLDAARIYV